MGDDEMLMIPGDRPTLAFIRDGVASFLDGDNFDFASMGPRDLAILAAFVELVVKKLRPLIGERVL